MHKEKKIPQKHFFFAALSGLITFAIVLASTLTLTVCDPTKPPPVEVKRDDKGFEIDPEGRWWKGDPHVHSTGASNDTGGDSFPEDIARVAKERGLNYVVLTDHSNSTGSDPNTLDEDPALFNKGPEFPHWEKAKSLSSSSFLMISGNELSPVSVGQKEPRGHIGCLPMDLDTFNPNIAFVDRPRGEVSGANTLKQALDAGCFAIINHPYSLAVWITYDWTSFDYNGMEIWNGGLGFDPTDEFGYDAWRCDLLKGRNVTPIGGSDNHRIKIEAPGKGLDPALGYPSTSIFAKSLSWPLLIEGLKKGLVALHEGESFLQIDPYDAEKKHATGKEIRFLRLRGKLDPAAQAAKLVLHQALSCLDNRPNIDPLTLRQEIVHEATIQPDESFDITVPISSPAGVYSAQLRPPGLNYVALSRAIVIP